MINVSPSGPVSECVFVRVEGNLGIPMHRWDVNWPIVTIVTFIFYLCIEGELSIQAASTVHATASDMHIL